MGRKEKIIISKLNNNSIPEMTAIKREAEDDNLPDSRKVLITPVWISVKEKMRRWNNESSEPYMKYKENLIHETDRGEFVRSKSEKEIANELNYHSNRLDYKYERPLTMINHGHEEIFHPDFTVINRITGNIKYWEHAGRMDDPGYVNHFVGKMNTYIENGIFPGEDLIVTYETSCIPLNKRNIRAWIEQI